MKSFVFLLFALLGSIIMNAQTKATTTDGKGVVLNDDGTWTFEKSTPKAEPTATVSECFDHEDKVTGRITTMTDNLVLSSDGKTGLVVFFMKLRTGDKCLSIKAVGSNCMDKNTKINILFKDGSRLELSGNNDFNCESRTSLYFGESFKNLATLENIAAKEIETIRVQTYKGFVEKSLSDTEAAKLKAMAACIK